MKFRFNALVFLLSLGLCDDLLAQRLYIEDFLPILDSSAEGIKRRISERHSGISYLRIHPANPTPEEKFYDDRLGNENKYWGELIPGGSTVSYIGLSQAISDRPLFGRHIIRLDENAPPWVVLHEFGHYLLGPRFHSGSAHRQRVEIEERLRRAAAEADEIGMAINMTAEDIARMARLRREQWRLDVLAFDVHYAEENIINEFLLNHADELNLSPREKREIYVQLWSDYFEMFDHLNEYEAKVSEALSALNIPQRKAFEDFLKLVEETRTKFNDRLNSFMAAGPHRRSEAHYADVELAYPPDAENLYHRLGLNPNEAYADFQVKEAYLTVIKLYDEDMRDNDPYAMRNVQAYTEAYSRLRTLPQRWNYLQEAKKPKRVLITPHSSEQGRIQKFCGWAAGKLRDMLP